MLMGGYLVMISMPLGAIITLVLDLVYFESKRSKDPAGFMRGSDMFTSK